MNPVHWIRWKLLIVLGVILGGLLFFGINPLAKAGINRLGTAGDRARWSIDGFAFSPISGRLTVSGLNVANAAVPAGTQPATRDCDQVLSAESLVFDLDMGELMRRRYCGQMQLQTPKLTIERRADGTMTFDFGQQPTAADTGPTDWWGQAQEWLNKIRQLDEERRRIAEKLPEEKIEQKAQEVLAKRNSRFHVDYSQRIQYPFEHVVRFVATRIAAEVVEITFVDNTPAGRARGTVPPVKNGHVLIENVSDNPAVHPEPIRWTITGEIAGAPIKLVGTLDQRRAAGSASDNGSVLKFDFQADALPVEIAQFFAGDSLPMQFDRGTLQLATTATIVDWNKLDVRPTLGFHDAAVSARPGTHSIAGVNSEVFCRAFNEIGTLEINDMHVTGTVSDPEVDLGHTVTDLARSGGRAIVKKQIDKGVRMGSEKLTQAVDKELGKLGGQDGLPPEVGKTVDDVKKGLGDRLKGLPFGEKPKKNTTK